MTVGWMLKNMSSKEFTDWMVFATIENSQSKADQQKAELVRRTQQRANRGV